MAVFFIKKMWQNEVDETVHTPFIRFSRGRFENRFVINISKNGKCKLSSSFELVNTLVTFISSLASLVRVTGIILTRENPDELFKQTGIDATFRKKSKVFEANIDAELTREQIEKIAEKAYFMLVDCSAEGIELKTKKKLPRPPKSGAEKSNDKFCVLEADIKYWPQMREEFAFDLQDFKKAHISHIIEINDITLPKGEKDFEKIRLNAKRKGRIIRQITADGKEKISEKDFVA